MKIGIIGSGNMGRVLGLLWMEKGHEVFFGSASETSLAFIKQTSKKQIASGTLEEAVRFGDVLLYTLRNTLPSEVVDINYWQGKIIIDCNNGPVPDDFKFNPVAISFAERYQKDLPESFVIKAFNNIAQEVFHHTTDVLKKSGANIFLAGDDSKSKDVVSYLVRDTGLIPSDTGSLQNSRVLETIADLIRYNIIKSQAGPFYLLKGFVLPPLTSCRFGDRQPTKYK